MSFTEDRLCTLLSINVLWVTAVQTNYPVLLCRFGWYVGLVGNVRCRLAMKGNPSRVETWLNVVTSCALGDCAICLVQKETSFHSAGVAAVIARLRICFGTVANINVVLSFASLNFFQTIHSIIMSYKKRG